MKIDCEVVRDLMPLVVDGTASEKSREMVEEHVAECGPCRVVLEEMRQEVSAEPPKRHTDRLVKKLRRRRRLRRVMLVLLSMAVSMVVLAACFQGWQYYFNSYNVLTAVEDYEIALVPKERNGVQMILTICDGYEQIPHAVFVYDTGNLYLWSDTTRLPWPARHNTKTMQLSELFYFEDLGYAERNRVWDEEKRLWYTDVTPVQRIYKGADGAPDGALTLLYELERPADQELVEQWRARLTDTWGMELNPPTSAE